MGKQIITGVLSVVLLFLLLAFAGAVIVDRDYTYSNNNRNIVVYENDDYQDDSDSSRNVNIVVYDDYTDDNYDKNSYYYLDNEKTTDGYYKRDDYDYKKVSGECYKPINQIKEKRCYRHLPQVRTNCQKGSYGCYEEGYYGRYYGSSYYMYDYDYNCY